MTAPPLSPPVLDWPSVLVAGMAALGVQVTASLAAPLVCDCWEVDCPEGHLWLAPTAAQRAVWARDGAR